MARRGEIYTSGYLKAQDMLDAGVESLDLTIKGVTTETLDDGNRQRVLTFHEDERSLGLNATNWDNIAEITGQFDDENWIGHRICVYPHKLDRPFNGRTHGVRVRRCASQPAAKPAAAPAESKAPPAPASKAPPAPAKAAPARPAPMDKDGAWTAIEQSLAADHRKAGKAGPAPSPDADTFYATIAQVGDESTFGDAEWRKVVQLYPPF